MLIHWEKHNSLPIFHTKSNEHCSFTRMPTSDQRQKEQGQHAFTFVTMKYAALQQQLFPCQTQT